MKGVVLNKSIPYGQKDSITHFTLKKSSRVYTELEFPLETIDPKRIDKVWEVDVEDMKKLSKLRQTPIPKQSRSSKSEDDLVVNVEATKVLKHILMPALKKSPSRGKPVIDDARKSRLSPSKHEHDDTRKTGKQVNSSANDKFVRTDKMVDTNKKGKVLSCFACHEKGHVYSVCPNRPRRSGSPSKATTSEGRSGLGNNKPVHEAKIQNSSQPFTIPQRRESPPKGFSFKGNVHWHSNEKRNVSPQSRSISPREDRFSNPTGSSSRSQTFPSRNSYYDRVHTTVRPSFGPHSPRPSPMRGQQSSPVRRQDENQVPSTASSDGYWTELILQDENGRPKPMKVWVPHKN
jgi:hypothetical protein